MIVPLDPLITFVVAAFGTVAVAPAFTFSPVTAPLAILLEVMALAWSAAGPTASAFSFGAVMAPFLIFTWVTALAFSCLAPTLFLRRWPAARAVAPPRMRKTAIEDITFA